MAATVKYDTLGVFVGPPLVTGHVPSGDIKQLTRVQSSSYSIELQRERVVGLGSAYANDGNVVTPFVNISFEYLVTNGENEKNLGLTVDGTHGSFLSVNSGERDYYLLVDNPDEPMVLAVGNCTLSKYSVGARINDFLKANVEVRGFNMQLDEGTSGNYVPKVNSRGTPQTEYTYHLPYLVPEHRERLAGVIEDNLYIGPHQLSISFPSGAGFGTPFSGGNSAHLQDFNFSIGLDRTDITRLGEKYPVKRCLSLPTELTLQANFLLNQFEADKIQNYFCQNSSDIVVDIHSDSCFTTDDFWMPEADTIKLKYIFKGMKLRSFSSSDSIGDRKNVSVTWAVNIGNLLDIKRNLFISGDYGRYLFPIDSVINVSGEQGVTGQGLAPLTKEIQYKRTKSDVKFPDFTTKFTSELETQLDDPEYYVYYQGSSGAVRDSGFGASIVETNYAYSSDSYSTLIDALPESGFTQKFSTLVPAYAVGYPELNDLPSGSYPFYMKGDGIHDEPINITFANVPTWLAPTVEYDGFQIDPYKPYYFNKVNLTITDVSIPTGTSVDIAMIAQNTKFRKVYTLNVVAPYSFHITLPYTFSRRTSLLLQPYNETHVVVNPDNSVSQITNSATRSGTFLAITGDGQTIEYHHKQLNEKSYLSFDSGSLLRATGLWLQDFRQFTIHAVFRPSGSSAANAQLLRFYQTDTGSAGYRNEAYLQRKGVSQDLEFYYVNPTGATGFYTGAHLQVTSCWDTNGWNIATVVFDGATASGYRSGVLAGTASFGIPNSGAFNRVDIGSGFHGDIAELILAPYKFHPSENTHIQELLKYKFGF